MTVHRSVLEKALRAASPGDAGELPGVDGSECAPQIRAGQRVRDAAAVDAPRGGNSRGDAPASAARTPTPPRAGSWGRLLSLSALLPARGSTPQRNLCHAFDLLLQRHLCEGRVDYPGLARTPELDVCLELLRSSDPDALPTRQERLAFWINAHNAFVIESVLQGFSPDDFSRRVDFFFRPAHEVRGRMLSLQQIEHDVLRPFAEPRMRFALHLASVSGPPLRAEAYRAARLDQQLDEQVRRFVNDPVRNRFHRRRRIAWLSKLFDWHARDFGALRWSVLRFVARHVDDPGLAHELREPGRWRVEYLDQDWRLDGEPLATPSAPRGRALATQNFAAQNFAARNQ